MYSSIQKKRRKEENRDIKNEPKICSIRVSKHKNTLSNCHNTFQTHALNYVPVSSGSRNQWVVDGARL